MFKEVTERPQGYLRPIIHTVMLCDRCLRPINWCAPHPKGQFCEDCLEKLQSIEKRANK